MKKILLFFFSFLCCFLQSVFAINSGSVYKISTYYTGNRVLTTENSTFDNNAKVFLWTNTDVNAQRWIATGTGNGSFYLDNAYTGKRLYAQTNTAIVQTEQNTTNSHKWIFTAVDGYPDCYYITNAGRAGCLDLTPGSEIDNDGSPIRFATQLTTPDVRQIWKIEQVAAVPNELSPAIRDAMMQGWKNRYFTWLKSSTGFWGEAELNEIILDAYETTGKEEYKIMFEEAYEHFVSGTGGWGQTNGQNWMWNEFNDDVAWGVLMSIRAHFMFGSHPNISINYLNIARTNFDNMYKRALYKVDNLYYLLRWKEGQAGTTSCVNGPAEIAACYLGIATGDNLYFEKAKMLYENQRVHMFEPTTGRVFDGFNNSWASAYNQGTYLGAALMLYKIYGDEMYKKDAEKIMEFTMNNLCNSEGILTSVDSESGDYPNFKAILLRYVRRYVDDLGKLEAAEWLQKNALRAYNNRNTNSISRVEWRTKTGETDDWNSYGAFAAVAVAMNAPLDINTIYKDAFSTIKAGSFDYISKVFAENVTDGENLEIASINNGAYLGFNLVDCKNSYATGIDLELFNDGTVRSVEVRLDSPTGTLLVTVAVPVSNSSWQNVSATFDQAISGQNNIYLVFKGDKNALRFKSFRLHKGQTIYTEILNEDITDDGGMLTSEYVGNTANESLEKLTDNATDTKYLLSNQSNLWVQYEAQKQYLLNSYSISSADDDPTKDPRDWTLYGSDNGTTWVVIDTRQGQVFDQRKATISYQVDAENPYQYYKLQVTANNGSTGTQFSEWQLIGDVSYASYSQDFVEVGGLSSATATSEMLAALNDNDPTTVCTISANELPIIIEYKSPVPIQLFGYTLTSSGESDSFDPKSWYLRASKDGTTWVSVDRRTNQTFESRNLKKSFDRTNATEYSYFRLEIDALNNATSKTVKIAEWEINGFYINNYDMTFNPSGNLSAQWDGNYDEEKGVDERYEKLIDKNRSGKYLPSYRKTFWATYRSARPAKLYAYSLTSANDGANRDPKNWTLYGSNNNSTWEVLDKQENQTFQYRFSTLYYVCNTTNKYRYFKLDVDENHGEKNVQLAEWQLFGEFNEYQQDITEKGGLLTSSVAATDGTELGTLTDNSEISKYYTNITNANFGEGIWFKYESPTAVLLSSYSLTSSNDNPNNDPKDWKLQASNDDATWVDLDIQSEVSFDSRSERKEYQVSTSAEYKYFKLFVTARKSNLVGFQLAEWELFGLTTGLNNLKTQSVRIYPNPADDIIYINPSNDGFLEIFDIEGSKIQALNVVSGTSSVDVGSFPKGVYIVKIRSNSSVEVGRFIKNK